MAVLQNSHSTTSSGTSASSAAASAPSSSGQLQFRALDNGLGFHPFSDGLPYAPANSPTPQLAPQASTATISRAAAPAPAAVKIASTSVSSSASISPQPKEVELPSLYLTRRFVAWSLDFVATQLLCAVLLLAVFWQLQLEWDVLLEPALFSGTLLFAAVFHWFSVTLQEVLLQTSFGKAIVGFKLEGSAGRIFLRSIFFYVSLFPLGLGLIWALLDTALTGRKRCWHDLISGVQPTGH